MSLIEREGDLFDSGLKAIGHGVNCRGEMGAGIAVGFKQRWPEMYEAYRSHCLEDEMYCGDVMAWPLADGRVIYNLATQFEPGRDARLGAVEECVTEMVRDARERDIDTIGLPWIGCGIGGLSKDDVRPILERCAEESGVVLVVFTLAVAHG